jgi:methylisocitrate lyase
MKLYVEAGAEIAFADALRSADEFRQFATAVKVPVLANLTEFGRTPALTAAELQELGIRIVIWPVSSLRIAAHAMENFYRQLATDGTTEPQLSKMQTRARLYETIGYHDYEALDASIVKSLLPKLDQT